MILALIAALAVCPLAVAAEPGFSGAVRDAAGNWLSDVEILVISPAATAEAVRPVATVRSDVKGRFLVTSLERGSYQIAAVKRGYRTYIGQVNTNVDRWIQLVLHPQARLDAAGQPLPEDDAWALRLPRRNILRETEAGLPELEMAEVRRPRLSSLPVQLQVDQVFKVATDLQRAPEDESVVQGMETHLRMTMPLGTRGEVSASGARERLSDSRLFDGSAPTRERDRLSAGFSYDTSLDTRLRVETEYAGRSARWHPRAGVVPAIDHDQESWRGAVGFEKQVSPGTHFEATLGYASSDLTIPIEIVNQVATLVPHSINRSVNGWGGLTHVGSRGRSFQLDFDVRHLELSAPDLYATTLDGRSEFSGVAGWTAGLRARETRALSDGFSLIYGVGYRHAVDETDATVWSPHVGGRFDGDAVQVQWIATYYGTEDWSETSSVPLDDRESVGYEAEIELPVAQNITLMGSHESRPFAADRIEERDEHAAYSGPAWVTDGNAAVERSRVALTHETPTVLIFAELSRGVVEGSVAAVLPYDLPFQQLADRDLSYHNGRIGLRFVPQGTLLTFELREVQESRRAARDTDSSQRQVEITLIQDLLERDDLGRWRFLMGLSMAEWNAGDPDDLRQIVSADRLDTMDGRLSAGLSLEF